METVILVIVVGIAVLLSVVATWMVRRCGALSSFQKVAQIVLVWVVPLVGAIVVIAILTEPTDRRERIAESGSSNEILSHGGYLGGDTSNHGDHGQGGAGGGGH
jgi:hypothetical protein